MSDDDRPAADRLIVFTRYPTPGRAKTRLIPALGARGAADLHQRMTRHTLAAAETLCRAAGPHVEVRFCGGHVAAIAALYGARFRYVEQGGGGLGARLARATADAFAAGCRRAVLVGTDCPGLTAEVLRDAFARLAGSPVVLGPANDGGYYLIGLARPAPALFRSPAIEWGSSRVLRQSLEVARVEGLAVALLAELTDVDVPADLHACDAAGLL